MKDFMKIIVIAVVLGAVGYMLWNGKLGKEVRYSTPLSAMTDRTFNPDPEKDAANLSSIKAALDSSQRKIRSGSGIKMDQVTVELCETLISVYNERDEYARRVAASQGKKYESLSGGTSSEKTRQAMLDAMRRQHEQSENTRRARANELLDEIKQAK